MKVEIIRFAACALFTMFVTGTCWRVRRRFAAGGRWVRLSAGLCAELGFRDVSRYRKHETVMRLCRAGFIDMVQPSPGVWLLDIDSWFRHLKACAENPEMWEDGSEDRDTYLRLNALGGWKRSSKVR